MGRGGEVMKWGKKKIFFDGERGAGASVKTQENFFPYLLFLITSPPVQPKLTRANGRIEKVTLANGRVGNMTQGNGWVGREFLWQSRDT